MTNILNGKMELFKFGN